MLLGSNISGLLCVSPIPSSPFFLPLSFSPSLTPSLPPISSSFLSLFPSFPFPFYHPHSPLPLFPIFPVLSPRSSPSAFSQHPLLFLTLFIPSFLALLLVFVSPSSAPPPPFPPAPSCPAPPRRGSAVPVGPRRPRVRAAPSAPGPGNIPCPSARGLPPARPPAPRRANNGYIVAAGGGSRPGPCSWRGRKKARGRGRGARLGRNGHLIPGPARCPQSTCP